jgi:DivIVA domain-containing protein
VVHLVLYGLLAIIVAAALFLLASRFLPAGEQIAPALRDEPPWELPAERVLTADDVDAVRLPVALRGYRFAEVDILLERLAYELRRRDVEIAQLRGEAPEQADEPVPPEAYAPPEQFAPPAVALTKADDAAGDDRG